MLDLFIA